MTAAFIGALYTLLRFSNGRRIFVLKEVLAIATGLAKPRLTTRVEEALAFERNARKLERRWRRTKAKTSKARGEAKVLDAQLDRVISAMYASLQSVLATIDPRSAHAGKVRTFLDTYFPEGAEGITNAEFDDALSIIEEMNEDFALLSEDDIKELNITYQVPELARLGPLFAAELSRPEASHTIRFEKVSAARTQGHKKLCRIVSTIHAEYDEDDGPEAGEAQAALLAPILAANERVAQRRKRRNGPDVDVNPDTGEELEGVQDLDTDVADDDEDGQEEETS